MTHKPPLVLLPGLLNDEALWHQQVQKLGSEWNIFVPDLTKDISIAGLAASILKQIQGPFVLGGLSMGGYTALEIVRQAPLRVAKLILMNTSARPDSEEQIKNRKNLISLASQGKFKGVTRKLLPMLIAPEHVENPILAQTIFDMAERVGRESFVRQQTAIMNRSDQRPNLTKIRCPLLIIGGEHDQITPPQVQKEIAAAVPDSRLEILKACGHLSSIEQPFEVSRLLGEFLST